MREIFTNDYVWAFILGAMPISEIRGSIIYIYANINEGFSIPYMFIASVIGNILPVPFVILLFRPIMEFCKRFKPLGRMGNWLEERTSKKAGKVLKRGLIALFIFVAIPFPLTGAYTAAMISAFLRLNLRSALPVILAGVLTSGLVMCTLFEVGMIARN